MATATISNQNGKINVVLDGKALTVINWWLNNIAQTGATIELGDVKVFNTHAPEDLIVEVVINGVVLDVNKYSVMNNDTKEFPYSYNFVDGKRVFTSR